MIAYFETSALIKVFIEEEGSETAARTWDAVDARVSSRLTYPEARAALAAARRADRLSRRALESAKAELESRFEQIDVIEVGDQVAREAGELAEALGLRAYDAVHLASVLMLRSSDLVLATWDQDLLQAAESLGVDVASS